ncbi:hypothetical protein Ndes2437B_g02858 [Nannochloris sp. 'desiccata']
MVNGAMWLNPRGPYKTMEDLWDEVELEDFEASDVGVCLCVEEEEEEKEEEKKEEEEEKKLEGELCLGSISPKGKGGLGGRLANWLGKKK